MKGYSSTHVGLMLLNMRNKQKFEEKKNYNIQHIRFVLLIANNNSEKNISYSVHLTSSKFDFNCLSKQIIYIFYNNFGEVNTIE